jgi:hypothetical protein
MACYAFFVLARHILTLTFAIVAYWRWVRCVGKHFCGIVALPIQFLSNESKRGVLLARKLGKVISFWKADGSSLRQS